MVRVRGGVCWEGGEGCVGGGDGEWSDGWVGMIGRKGRDTGGTGVSGVQRCGLRMCKGGSLNKPVRALWVRGGIGGSVFTVWRL